ncbi:MAG TPA: hypothetical protein PLI72_05080, partial [Smithellaceae bacterium]|nr:hypothetical protein [Smithellaceae bacterium]
MEKASEVTLLEQPKLFLADLNLLSILRKLIVSYFFATSEEFLLIRGTSNVPSPVLLKTISFLREHSTKKF